MFAKYRFIVSKLINPNHIFCLLGSIVALCTFPIQAEIFDPIKSPSLDKNLIQSSSNSLKYKIDRNYRVIQDLPDRVVKGIMPLIVPNFPLPPRSNYNTWVGVNIFTKRKAEHGGRPTLLEYDETTVHILNPGLTTASVVTFRIT